MRLEPATKLEEEAIAALMNEAFLPYTKSMGKARPGPYPWLKEDLAEGRGFWLCSGDVRVGVTILGDKAGGLELKILAIDPAYQRAGFGSAALAIIEDEARHRRASWITLSTASRRTHLVAFYSKHGFRVWKCGPPDNGRDDFLRVYMTKSLD